MNNPFEHVRPLPPGAVRGRDELAERLLTLVRERSLAAVTGPRRYGKTSLLNQVVDRAVEAEGLDALVVDCFGVASVGEFAVRLERTMESLSGPARKLVRRLFESSELGLSISPGIGFKAAFGRRDTPDPTAVLHELLDTVSKVADRRGGLLLVLDEFQDVGRIENLDALLRTHLQQARQVAVLFAGSRPSLLRALFEDRVRPFYAQAEIVEIDRLNRAVAAHIVEDGFSDTNRDASDVAETVAAAVDGHPQRLMLVAHLLWNAIAEGAAATPEDVGAALEAAHLRTVHEHRGLVEGLDRTHRDALRAIAAFGSPYTQPARRALDLAPSSAQSALRALLADGLVEADDERWRVVDPLLIDWLRHELPLPTP